MDMHRWRMPEGLRWYSSFSSPSNTNDLAVGTPSQSPSLGLVEGHLSSEEIFQVRGLSVRDRCDPIPLPFNA
jgi:hypothetical protein